MALRPLLRTITSPRITRCLAGSLISTSHNSYSKYQARFNSSRQPLLSDDDVVHFSDAVTEQIPATTQALPSGPVTKVSWEDRFKQLQDYVKQNGCFPSDVKYAEILEVNDTNVLHAWCRSQQQMYTKYQRKLKALQEEHGDKQGLGQILQNKHAQATAERIRLLNSIGFVWERRNASWNRMYQALQEFYNNHQHTLVPIDFAPNRRLGIWVSMQRKHYELLQRNDPKTQMTEERIQRLEQLDFKWNALDARWLASYGELVEFQRASQRFGAMPSKRQNGALGAWCIRQRKQGRAKRQGKLTPLTDEREAMLNKLGFRW
ncbi:hypothetical protein MPSEU_000986900 [Mayamaea pseudoterrestris]|nr:hypothetical protein MPSEU_000986900 [Mayamaea pseudoterrestris]